MHSTRALLTSSFILVTTLATLGQKNVELTEVPFYDIEKANTQDFRVIGHNSTTLFALRHLKRVVEKNQYDKVDNIGWLIEGYSIPELIKTFTVPVELPIKNTEWISLHDYFPLDNGLGLFVSFYDNEQNARVIAVCSINNDGAFNDELTIIESVPAKKEKKSKEFYVSNDPKHGTVLTTRPAPLGSSVNVKTPELKVITLTPAGSLNFSNTWNLSEYAEPIVPATLVGATTNGNVLYKSYRRINGKVVWSISMLKGESGELVHFDRPEYKERFGKRYNGVWDSFFREIPGKGSVYVEMVLGKYKYEKRVIAFRILHMSREGDLVSDRFIEVVDNETHEVMRKKYSDDALHGSYLNSISISGDEIIMTATRKPYRKKGIGRVSEVAINYVNGSLRQRSCERNAIMNEDWSETRALAYHFKGDTYHIAKLPEQWIGRDCESLERFDKKGAKELQLAWTVTKLSDTENTIEDLNFSGQRADSEVYAYDVMEIQDRRLGVFLTITKRAKESEYYYIGWLE